MDSLLELFIFLNVGNIFFFFFVGWIGYSKEKEKHIDRNTIRDHMKDGSSIGNYLIKSIEKRRLERLSRGETLEEEAKRLARRQIKDSVCFCAFCGKWINGVILFSSLFVPSFPSFSPVSLIPLVLTFVCYIVNKKTFVRTSLM